MNNPELIKNCIVSNYTIDTKNSTSTFTFKSPDDKEYTSILSHSLVYIVLYSDKFREIFKSEYKYFDYTKFNRKIDIIIENNEVISIIYDKTNINASGLSFEDYEQRLFVANLNYKVPKNNTSNKKTKI